MAAIDVSQVAEDVAGVVLAIGLTGVAVLMVQALLVGVRQLRELLGGGGGRVYTPAQVAAIKAKEAAGAGGSLEFSDATAFTGMESLSDESLWSMRAAYQDELRSLATSAEIDGKAEQTYSGERAMELLHMADQVDSELTRRMQG